MRLVGLYFRALWREWKVLLTGGTIMALVAGWALATGTGIPVQVGWLILGITFISASFAAWKREYVKVEGQTEGKAKLEVRFGQDEPYKRQGRPYTYYRVGVYNFGPAPAENLELWLMSIEPRPHARIFNTDYPYRVRRASSVKADDTGCRLNPQHEELFELFWFWLSSPEGEGMMVNGIDTKRQEAMRPFPIRRDESWRLTYKISCANSDPQVIVFGAMRQGDSVLLERIS